MIKTFWFILPLMLLTVVATLAAPRNEQRSERIHFSPDSPSGDGQSARVKAHIRGFQTIEYLIEARTGQSLTLNLRSDNTQSGFRITAPAAPKAMHSASGQQPFFDTTLPRDGTYRVVIFLQDNAAENGESAVFSLYIRLSNPG